jgi:hypothetical protein
MLRGTPAASHTALAEVQIGSPAWPVPRTLNSPLTSGCIEQPQRHIDHVADPDEVAPLRAVGRAGLGGLEQTRGPLAATSSCLILTTEIMPPLGTRWGHRH